MRLQMMQETEHGIDEEDIVYGKGIDGYFIRLDKGELIWNISHLNTNCYVIVSMTKNLFLFF